jgi:hypothetical protein
LRSRAKVPKQLALLAGIVAVIVLTGAVISSAGDPPTTQDHLPVSPAPAEPTRTVPAAASASEQAAFGVLRGAAPVVDLTGRFEVPPGIVARAGANLTQARLAATADGVQVYIVPGDDMVCLVTIADTPLASSCDTVANAKAGTLAGTTTLKSGETFVYGLAVDGTVSATANLPSGDRTFAVAANTYAGTVPTGMDGIRLHGAGSSDTTIGLHS